MTVKRWGKRHNFYVYYFLFVLASYSCEMKSENSLPVELFFSFRIIPDRTIVFREQEYTPVNSFGNIHYATVFQAQIFSLKYCSATPSRIKNLEGCLIYIAHTRK